MRIGTRRSALALAQAELVGRLLGDGCEIVPMVTRGDRANGPGDGTDEDKSRWVAELEDALVRGDIDLAVHSAKDVPGELAHGLALLGAPARAGAEDVLCGADSLDALAPGARVATSSVRRVASVGCAVSVSVTVRVMPIVVHVYARREVGSTASTSHWMMPSQLGTGLERKVNL